MQQMLMEAIANRLTLSLIYHGIKRTVEPHTYGVDTHGEECLSAYQLGGDEIIGNSPGWKLFKVDAISGLTLAGRTFEGAEAGYSRSDPRMSLIYAEL